MKPNKALGIDVGASGIKGAIVDLKTGEFLTDRVRFETPSPKNPKNMVKTIGELVKHFDWKDSIGVGFPAVVKQGIVLTASNIDKSWIGQNAKALIENETGCKTCVLNDADAAGYAEFAFGKAKDHMGKLIFITIGSGLGSAIIYKGELIPNTELGHVELKGDIAENYAADSIRKAKELSWKKWGKRFNQYLQLIDRSFLPDVILLGGGTSKHFSKYEEYFDVNAEVMPALLENKAGIVGAAMMASKA